MYNNSFYPYLNYGYSRPGLLGRLSSFASGKKINWSGILNNTQKTLNIINQAIPVIYQVKPIYNNAKTIFRVMNAVKDKPVQAVNTTRQQTGSYQTQEVKNVNNDTPTFFL